MVLEQIEPIETATLDNSADDSFKLIEPRKPEYLIRQRRRRIAAIIFGVSISVITVLIIIALLGRNFGSFTVKLEQVKNELSLGDSLTAGGSGTTIKNKTTYLMAGGYEANTPMCADDLAAEDYLDKDITDETVVLPSRPAAVSPDEYSQDYSFKYTFYLRNSSPTEMAKANYYIDFASITEPTNVDASCSIEDIVRVRVYDSHFEDESIEHSMVGTYARKAKNFSTNGANNELITGTTGNDRGYKAKNPENQGYCTNFLNDDGNDPLAMIVMKNETYLLPREIRRFTVVIWLEGFDADCVGENPVGAALTLSMHFTSESLTQSWAKEESTPVDSAARSSESN